MSRVIIFIFLVQILFPMTGNAQGYNRFGGNTNVIPKTQPAPAPAPVPILNEVTEWSLPPLQMMINTAVENSPLIHLANANIQMGKYEFKDACREWLKNVSLVADARYGNMVNYATSQNTGVGIISNNEMWNYGAGVSTYLPFSEIFDKKRAKQKARLKIEQAEIQKEDIVITLSQTVITAYYEVLAAQKTLAMYNEISLSATMLYEQAKLDFNTNRLPLSDFTEKTEAYLTAQNKVEVQKYDLMKSIRILELIVGIELIR